MPYLYLILATLGIASTNVIAAFYNRKNANEKNTSSIYTLLVQTAIFLCWLVLFLFDGSYDLAVLPYAFIIAIFFTMCMVGNIYALKTGPVVLTSLALQLSLVGVTAWGFFFWGTQFTWLTAIGVVLVVISLWLCLYKGKTDDKKISWKWIVFALMAFVGNAVSSITQRTQQTAFNGQYGNFLMVVATGLSAIICFVLYLRGEKGDTKKLVKTSWYYPVLGGMMNVMLNVCVILLATSTLSPSIIYPVLAVGGLIIVTVFSKYVFKEDMRWWQWLGVLIGTLAVGILSV